MVVTNFKTYIEKLIGGTIKGHCVKKINLFCIKVFKSFCVDSFTFRKC
jgi:hypothetical protein